MSCVTSLSSDSTGQQPLNSMCWFKRESLSDTFSISFRWVNKKEVQLSSAACPKPLCTTQHLVPDSAHTLISLWAKPSTEDLGSRTGFMWAKQRGLCYTCGWFGPSTPAYPLNPRAKVYPPTLQLRHHCAPERQRPQTLGQRGELQKRLWSSRGLQRSEKIREGGYSEDHGLHTHTVCMYKRTWGTHTHYSHRA